MRLYYYYAESEESLWEAPSGWDARGPDEQTLAGEIWAKEVDQDSARYFYYNGRTQQSVWEMPRGWSQDGAENQVLAGGVTWTRTLDESVAKWFYHNPVSARPAGRKHRRRVGTVLPCLFLGLAQAPRARSPRSLRF